MKKLFIILLLLQSCNTEKKETTAKADCDDTTKVESFDENQTKENNEMNFGEDTKQKGCKVK